MKTIKAIISIYVMIYMVYVGSCIECTRMFYKNLFKGYDDVEDW